MPCGSPVRLKRRGIAAGFTLIGEDLDGTATAGRRYNYRCFRPCVAQWRQSGAVTAPHGRPGEGAPRERTGRLCRLVHRRPLRRSPATAHRAAAVEPAAVIAPVMSATPKLTRTSQSVPITPRPAYLAGL